MSATTAAHRGHRMVTVGWSVDACGSTGCAWSVRTPCGPTLPQAPPTSADGRAQRLRRRPCSAAATGPHPLRQPPAPLAGADLERLRDEVVVAGGQPAVGQHEDVLEDDPRVDVA